MTIDPDLKAGFPVQTYNAAGTYSSGPAIHTLVGSIDADPKLEIIVTGLAGGPLYAWHSDGSPVNGFGASSWDYYGAAYAGLGNFSYAYSGMQIFAGHFGFDYVPLDEYGGDGTILPSWPVTSTNYVSSPPAMADLDGDFFDEAYVNQQDWKLYAFKPDGSQLPGWPVTNAGSQELFTPAIADLDNDGVPEVISASQGGGTGGSKLYAWHRDGSVVSGFPVSFIGLVQEYVVVGDVDGDGLQEIIALGPSYNDLKVFIYSNAGILKHTITVGNGFFGHGSAPALADLDGDGKPEIILVAANQLFVWRGDGTVFPNFPIDLAAYGGGSDSSVVGDVDGDGYPDIVLTGSSVRVFSRCGVINAHFPKALTQLGSGAVPAIADIDLDGRNEIIVTGDYWNGSPGWYDKVWVYDLGGPASGRIEWGQFGGGPKHQNHYSLPPPIAPYPACPTPNRLFLPLIKK